MDIAIRILSVHEYILNKNEYGVNTKLPYH